MKHSVGIPPGDWDSCSLVSGSSSGVYAIRHPARGEEGKTKIRNKKIGEKGWCHRPLSHRPIYKYLFPPGRPQGISLLGRGIALFFVLSHKLRWHYQYQKSIIVKNQKRACLFQSLDKFYSTMRKDLCSPRRMKWFHFHRCEYLCSYWLMC